MYSNGKVFSGKVLLVTGSTTGIGQAIAVAFAGAGAKVVITGRNAQNLEETKKMCISAGAPEVLSVCGDITKDSLRAELVDKTIKTFSKIDILINNAGILPTRTRMLGLTNTELMDDYKTIFDTNVVSVVDLTKKCLDYIIASKGTIINISSVVSLKVLPNVLYGMSKAALDMFTKGLANELGPKGVRVNSINPGVIETNMMHNCKSATAKQFGITEDESLKNFRALSVLNKSGKPSDIANLALFLSSDDANFITGAIYLADGGALVK